MEKIVQFTDSTEKSINGVFSSPQPQDVVPHQGVVDTSDPRYREFYEAALDADRQYLDPPANLDQPD